MVWLPKCVRISKTKQIFLIKVQLEQDLMVDVLNTKATLDEIKLDKLNQLDSKNNLKDAPNPGHET